MVKNFAEIAFTDVVKKLQEKHGSRRSYERIEKSNEVDGLTSNETAFIENRDSFYLASFGANQFPYIQHRGGSKGFLKVLDSKRLGFIDFMETSNMFLLAIWQLIIMYHLLCLITLQNLDLKFSLRQKLWNLKIILNY